MSDNVKKVLTVFAGMTIPFVLILFFSLLINFYCYIGNIEPNKEGVLVMLTLCSVLGTIGGVFLIVYVFVKRS
jgi:hypothetical protein